MNNAQQPPANRLGQEISPYLLQHAQNPVDWFAWGKEALEKARAEDKPIFLSIGYAACHWCHVMAHESFEDAETAALMNAHFVNIKVDREERPDLDGIYMQAVVAMTGQGGWPMSVFLTPDLQPFYGGTYFPPVSRHNLPSFRELLLAIARLWRDERPRLLQSAASVTAQVKQNYIYPAGAASLDPTILDSAAFALAQGYDWKNGGWGRAPKFPQPMAIDFLLRKAMRGDSLALDTAIHALRAMAKGGMYDVAGGGFARYSTDDRWLAPHFEKMLYDNAQLALAYLHAFLITGEPQFRRVCEETLDFTARELMGAQGGFYSSLDADSEGEEGKFYLWTLEEIRALKWPEADEGLLLAAYGLTETGNFERKNILQRVMDDAALAERFNLAVEAIPHRLGGLHARLLEARSRRPRPSTDDKVITAWNGLMLRAFAEAARYLGADRRPQTADSGQLSANSEQGAAVNGLRSAASGQRAGSAEQRPAGELTSAQSKSSRYLSLAIRNARFLLDELHPAQRLLRSWRNGVARQPAFLEDYAAFILGLLSLYQSDPNPRWFSAATQLAEEMLALFSDPEPAGGFFDTGGDVATPLTRPKDLQDNATPSGNALAAEALLQLSAFNGDAALRARAEAMIAGMQALVTRHPTAFAHWLCAADFAIGPTQEAAIIGEAEDARTQALVSALWAGFRPRMVAARASSGGLPAGAPQLLQERDQLHGLPTAFLCQNFTCKQPVNAVEDFTRQLEENL